MRTAALLAVLVVAGCKTVEIVGADGGVVAECAAGYTICEPPGVADGGADEYVLTCVDTNVDPNNCGACGNTSCDYRGCVAGRCGACLPKGRSCGAAADCCSGKCGASAGKPGVCE